MIPVFCKVKHEPEYGNYGDCYRACIASILELAVDDVPHFFHDNAPSDVASDRCLAWLHERKLTRFRAVYEGGAPIEEMLEHMGVFNPSVHYILYGTTATAPHVVVCQGAKIVHDPAWYRSPIIGPAGALWMIDVIAVK